MRSLLAGFRRIENMTLQARIGEVTERIVERSRPARCRYLDRIEAAARERIQRNPDTDQTTNIALVMMLFETARLTTDNGKAPTTE